MAWHYMTCPHSPLPEQTWAVGEERRGEGSDRKRDEWTCIIISFPSGNFIWGRGEIKQQNVKRERAALKLLCRRKSATPEPDFSLKLHLKASSLRFSLAPCLAYFRSQEDTDQYRR